MANRSDFFKAKLPRKYKRMIAMSEAYGWINDSHTRGDIKRIFIKAHANAVAFKNKRNSVDNRDNSAGE